jgi:hypothetical protein
MAVSFSGSLQDNVCSVIYSLASAKLPRMAYSVHTVYMRTSAQRQQNITEDFVVKREQFDEKATQLQLNRT